MKKIDDKINALKKRVLIGKLNEEQKCKLYAT